MTAMGHDPPHAQGHQVVDDRARRPGIGPHAHHLVGVQAGFERGLGQGGVDVEIAVEEQVAEHADRQGGNAAAGCSPTWHGGSSAESAWASRLSLAVLSASRPSTGRVVQVRAR